MAKNFQEHNFTGIDATVIADSKSPSGNRMTTFVLTFPRIVLAEFNTHRAVSKNSASSRAIPFNKMMKMVRETPFIPAKWQKDHKGMQGTEYLSNEEEFRIEMEDFPDYQVMGGEDAAKELWLRGRDAAVYYAEKLNTSVGATKQLCNRMLEPYMWHTVIASGTEWENFFALRAESQAEIHIQELAYKMLEEYNNSEPVGLKDGEWHIPFSEGFDEEKATSELFVAHTMEDIKLRIAVARCARVSYLNFEGKDNYQADMELHDRLAELGHWSPFEHCAQALDKKVSSGNLIGFAQYRKLFEKENQTDNRVIRK